MRYQRNKLSCSDIEVIPEPFRALIRELNDPRFLRVLEQITGIKRLLPDPYLTGGGLHLSAPGGVLSPHTDFHYYRGLNLYRRINVLVYLNDGWSQQAGGCLSFYDAQHRAVKTVVPEWGRVVIFRTDYQSIHGFSAPVAEGKWRRSVALYNYTAAPTKKFSGDETTQWSEHGVQGGVIGKARLLVFDGCGESASSSAFWRFSRTPIRGS
jgi:Rps23 Pro-64 3,4-dihydroxylase Tpa1-like proline 4-hydroxylase